MRSLELSWFESLLFGLISGFTEVLPISSLAHQTLFLKLAGGNDQPLLRLFAHVGVILAVLTVYMPMLLRLRRERRLAAIPAKRRRRQPDPSAMMEIRLLRMAITASLVVLLSYPLVHELYQRLWLLAILVGINGIVMYIPQFLPGANKRAETMSALDGMVMGLSAGLGVVPGFSRVGFGLSAAMIRGTQRRYAADLAVLICVPTLFVMILIDGFAASAVTISTTLIIQGVTVMVAAFCAAWVGLRLLQFMAYRVGFSGFAYYSWGFALFALIIYLI